MSLITPLSHAKRIDDYLASFAMDLNVFMTSQVRFTIADMAATIKASLNAGGKLITLGNGGSASQAQHLTAEFIGRFQGKHQPLQALTLGSELPTLSALTNDFSASEALERHLEAVAKPQDAFLAFTTSAKSTNIIMACYAARNLNLKTFALTGPDPQDLKDICDRVLPVPGSNTQHIQELHALCIHILVSLVKG
jgi:phosphoheptose isomerase